MQLELDKGFYSKKAIEDTVYWFSNDYSISVINQGEIYIVKCSDADKTFKKKFLIIY